MKLGRVFLGRYKGKGRLVQRNQSSWQADIQKQNCNILQFPTVPCDGRYVAVQEAMERIKPGNDELGPGRE